MQLWWRLAGGEGRPPLFPEAAKLLTGSFCSPRASLITELCRRRWALISRGNASSHSAVCGLSKCGSRKTLAPNGPHRCMRLLGFDAGVLSMGASAVYADFKCLGYRPECRLLGSNPVCIWSRGSENELNEAAFSAYFSIKFANHRKTSRPDERTGKSSAPLI